MLQFDVVTLFPKMFDAITESGITGMEISNWFDWLLVAGA